MNSKQLILFFKGLSMGLADLIPGVSGGTIALILGIYKEFISSLKSINFQSINLLFRLNFKKLSQQINLKFLLPIFFGIVCAIFSFSNLIFFLLSDYRVLIFSFFFSLILFSSIKLIFNEKPYELYKITMVIIGIGIGYFISLIDPISVSNNYISIYLSACIAISAMLLPGISGSYILLILGKYEYILESVKVLRFDIILTFILGAITGIILFSKIINWLLSEYYSSTILFLSGLMLGALNKVWPWVYKDLNYFPKTYTSLSGDENYFIISILIFSVIGILSYSLKLKE